MYILQLLGDTQIIAREADPLLLDRVLVSYAERNGIEYEDLEIKEISPEAGLDPREILKAEVALEIIVP